MRLIDADALEDVLHNHGFWYCGETEYTNGVVDGFSLAIDDVKEAPTIEAVQVVRCKDCKYCNGEYEYCYFEIFVKPDGYCSYGEKMNEA